MGGQRMDHSRIEARALRGGSNSAVNPNKSGLCEFAFGGNDVREIAPHTALSWVATAPVEVRKGSRTATSLRPESRHCPSGRFERVPQAMIARRRAATIRLIVASLTL
jgi:hypothetical protein